VRPRLAGFLAYLAQRLEDLPVLLVASYRRSEPVGLDYSISPGRVVASVVGWDHS
jgi:hypothetical protein